MIIFALMYLPPIPDSIKLALFICCCAVITIQLFYYLYFFRRFAWYHPKVKSESQEYPVSVIVCSRNEAENLVKYLPGILVQNYRTTHEVIVVNDNSADETKYILEEFQRTFKNMNTVVLKQEAKLIPGKKFPLSVGIKTAKYEIVLLTDADCVPASEYWIQKMQDGYHNGIEIVLGYGAYQKRKGLLNKFVRFETFHSALQYFSFALAGMPYMGVGRNLSYKKGLFFKNKGFSSLNRIQSGDDDLFINMVATKNNTAIVIDKDAHTLSEPPKTWGNWLNQKYRHYTTAKFYKPRHKFYLGLYSFMYTLSYPLLIAALFYNWKISLVIFGGKLIIQGIIWYKSMKKLDEAGLWPFFLFFDIWMFFYYLLFVPALWKRPKKNWA